MSTHTHNNHAAPVRNANDIKISTRTLEFAVYVAAVIATIITAAVVGDDGSENGVDVFNASQAMQYITFLTVGLMVALAHPDRIARKRSGTTSYLMASGTGAALGGEGLVAQAPWPVVVVVWLATAAGLAVVPRYVAAQLPAWHAPG